MADTDFFTLVNVKQYLGITDTADDDLLNQLGQFIATKDTQNFLNSHFEPVPTVTAGTVTDEMKARTDYLVCELFKGHIKEYKAKDHFKDMRKLYEKQMIANATANDESPHQTIVVESSYKTEPMTQNEV